MDPIVLCAKVVECCDCRCCDCDLCEVPPCVCQCFGCDLTPGERETLTQAFCEDLGLEPEQVVYQER